MYIALEARSEPVIYKYIHTLLMVLGFALIGFVQVSAGITTSSTFASVPQGKVFEITMEDHKPGDEGKSLIPWFCAGSILGGFIIVGFRRLTDKIEAARYFGVSVVASLTISPMVVLSWGSTWFPDPKWYTALGITTITAGFAWAVMELVTLFFLAIYKATQERGIAGFRDQLILIISLGMLGQQPKNTADVTPGVPLVPPPQPNPPVK